MRPASRYPLSTSSISNCARKALCFSVSASGFTGSIALAISHRWSSGSAKGVEAAGVSCSSQDSSLVVVTEEYSDLFLRSRRVMPQFLGFLSTIWSRSLTGTGSREPSTMDNKLPHSGAGMLS